MDQLVFDGLAKPKPAARVFARDGQEQCPACGGPFHRRSGERGGYCERCDQLRVNAPRLVR